MLRKIQQESQQALPKMLTASQVAKLLNISPKTVVRWTDNGTLPPSFKSGTAKQSARRWSADAIAEFIKTHIHTTVRGVS